MFYNSDRTNFNDVIETIGRDIINSVPKIWTDSFDFPLKRECAKENRTSILSSKLDIFEDDNLYEVVVELPGMNKEDVKIFASQEDTLKIKATKKKPEFSSEGNKKVIHQERVFGEIVRTLTFQKPIDRNNISAKWRNGELIINVPKLKPIEAKEIEISVEY
ncbi:MAG: Hsp20/alpha crystallin family protein [Bacteroidetes bacterium]|nr:Hsp20/alpha crystallin family protein [Bacteroidota bacterium]